MTRWSSVDRITRAGGWYGEASLSVPTYVDSNFNTDIYGYDVDVTLPAYQAGDLVIVYIQSNFGTNAFDNGTPSGWTKLDEQGGYDYIFYKVMAGTEGATETWTSDVNQASGEAFSITVRNVDSSTPIETHTYNSDSSATITATGITTARDNAGLVMLAYTASSGVSSWSYPLTEYEDEDQTGAVAFGLQAKAGASGNKTASHSYNPWEAWLIEINAPFEVTEIEGTVDKTLGALASSSEGDAEIDGQTVETLGALTSSGAGEVEVEGQTDETLGALTLESDGTVVYNDITGTVDETLGALTSVGSGAVLVEGSTSEALDQLTADSAGEAEVAGSCVKDLGALTSVSAGEVDVEGQTAETLDTLTSSSVGEVDVEGQTAETLAALTLESEGYVGTVVQGDLDATLGALTSSGAGEVDIDGQTAETLDVLTSSGAGEVDIDGQTAETLDALTLESDGAVFEFRVGTVDETLGELTADGAGLVEIEGTATPTLEALTSSGAGLVEIEGQTAETLGALVSAGAGDVDITGSTSETLGALTLESEGTNVEGTVGVLSQTLGALTSSGAGEVDIEGQTAETLGALTSAGAGAVEIEGQTAETLGALTLDGEAAAEVQGALSKTLGELTGDSAGVVEAAGTLVQTLDDVSQSSAGLVEVEGTLGKTLEALTCSSTTVGEAFGAVDATLGDLTASSTAQVYEDIVWDDLDSCSQVGTVLTATGSSWGNVGAAGSRALNGEGYVEYTVPAVAGYWMHGLSSKNLSSHYNTVEFAMYTYPGSGRVLLYENGSNVASEIGNPLYSPGDKLRISLSGGVVRYYYNGTLMRTSPETPGTLMRPDLAGYQIGDTVEDPIVSGTLVDWPASAGAVDQTLGLLSGDSAVTVEVQGALARLLEDLALDAFGIEDVWTPRATLDEEFLTAPASSTLSSVVSTTTLESALVGSKTETELEEV